MDETVALLMDSSLAGKLITNDKAQMTEFVSNRFQHFNNEFNEDQILTVTKSLMNNYAKVQHE